MYACVGFIQCDTFKADLALIISHLCKLIVLHSYSPPLFYAPNCLHYAMLCRCPTLLSILPSFTLTRLSPPLSSHYCSPLLCYLTLSLGNIGCMVNGAGLAMATMDIIKVTDGDGDSDGVVAGGSLSLILSSFLSLLFLFTTTFSFSLCTSLPHLLLLSHPPSFPSFLPSFHSLTLPHPHSLPLSLSLFPISAEGR